MFRSKRKKNGVTQKAKDFCCVSFGWDTISKWSNAKNWHYCVCFDNYSQAGFSSSPESAYFNSTRVVHAQLALSLKGLTHPELPEFRRGCCYRSARVSSALLGRNWRTGHRRRKLQRGQVRSAEEAHEAPFDGLNHLLTSL